MKSAIGITSIKIFGPLGFETAYKLYKEKAQIVEEHRFPKFFLERFEAIADEMLITAPQGERIIYSAEIGEGGLFAALWEMGEVLGTGMEISLEDIYIRQEVIEMLELFAESPYECSSKGCYLTVDDILGKDGKVTYEIAGDLKEETDLFLYADIGHTCKEKSRVVISQDGERFLTPPERQQSDIADRKRKL